MPKFLLDFITAAERVGSKAEPITDVAWRNCTGKAIDGIPFHVATARAIATMGTLYRCHKEHRLQKRTPGGALARAIVKRRFEAPR